MLALIPLRGGSKGIPNKNIKQIAGQPLCQWVIDAALKSQMFDRIIVSTDSEKIAEIVFNHNGVAVEVMMRPVELAQDDTPSEAVMFHVAEADDFREICMIQATCPLTTPQDFLAARAKFMSHGYDSMNTVIPLNKFVWYNRQPINFKPYDRPMRQDIDPVYIETGNFYITKRWVLEKKKSRLGGEIGHYLMDKERAIDIDTIADFQKAEFQLRMVGK